MIVINLSGTSFLRPTVQLAIKKGDVKPGDAVRVVQMRDKSRVYDGDYCVVCKTHEIGWIPRLSTIKKYLAQAIKDNNRGMHDWHYDRYKLSEKLRGHIGVDIHRNGIEPTGVIEKVTEVESGYSISVRFNYE